MIGKLHSHSVCRCLYVFLMALVLIVIGGILTAFLYPRSIVINVLSVNPATLPNITSWYIEETNNNDNMSVLLGVEVTSKDLRKNKL